jgi:hypothetical protein
MAANRPPDLVILCSRRADTVTARVFAGILVPTTRLPIFPGHDGLWDLRSVAEHPAGTVGRLACRCGSEHDGWVAEVILGQRGKRTTTTEDVERLSREFLTRD